MSHSDITTPLPGIQAAPGNGLAFDHGAQVVAWRPADQPKPVLWLSSTSAFEAGKAIRGGVPICFPWFGPGLGGDRKPAHGFARTTAWRRDDVRDHGDVVRVRYSLDPTLTGEQPGFPYSYRAGYTVDFAPDHLLVTLRTENTGDEPFTFEQALHTYLVVGDVRQITIDGLDGATYLDKNTARPAFDRTQSGPLRLTGPTDRVYEHDGLVTIHDSALNRRLEVSGEGSANVVVWNPWQEAAAGMADVGSGEWTGFVCVEAANVLAEAITLLPTEHWTMSQRIRVTAQD